MKSFTTFEIKWERSKTYRQHQLEVNPTFGRTATSLIVVGH